MRTVRISTAIKLFSTNFPHHVYLHVATSYHYRKKSCRKEARSQGCLNPRGHLSSRPWLADSIFQLFFTRPPSLLLACLITRDECTSGCLASSSPWPRYEDPQGLEISSFLLLSLPTRQKLKR